TDPGARFLAALMGGSPFLVLVEPWRSRFPCLLDVAFGVVAAAFGFERLVAGDQTENDDHGAVYFLRCRTTVNHRGRRCQHRRPTLLSAVACISSPGGE